MSEPLLRRDRDDRGVVTLTLNRPQAFNALSALEHHDLFQPAILATELRCLVLELFDAPREVIDGTFEVERLLFLLDAETRCGKCVSR